MKKVQMQSLKEGMVFTSDVFIDETNLLVPAGIPIKTRDLAALARWGVTHVTTDGEVVKNEIEPRKEGGGNPQTILKIPAVNENKELYKLYTDMVDRLNMFFGQVKRGETADTKIIDMIVQSLLRAVREQETEIIGFILGGEIQGTALAKSSVNTAILSAIIASHLKFPSHKLLLLVTGALLHDVGMMKIPDEITKKQGSLSGEDLQKIHAHPLYSYRIITKDLNYPEEVGAIGLQHHERYDGDGYPRKTMGAQIDLGARIVSVADAFEAMVSEKTYRNSMIGYQAMKNLLSDNSRRFDPEILRVFIKGMGIYPIGSIVLLNNAAIARVFEGHQDAPLRPKIRILIDEYGRQYLNDEGDVIDLLAEKTLFIARPINPKEYQA